MLRHRGYQVLGPEFQGKLPRTKMNFHKLPIDMINGSDKPGKWEESRDDYQQLSDREIVDWGDFGKKYWWCWCIWNKMNYFL